MSPELIDVLTRFGLPTTLLIVVLWSGNKGYWVWGYTHREIVTRQNVDIANLRNELRESREQYRQDMQKERELFNSVLGVGERIAAAAEKATTR